SDPDGTVTQVEFLANAASVAAASSPPYVARWSGVAPGAYTLTAKATDDRGATTVSQPVAFVVASNAPPTVAMISPLRGAAFFAPATIVLAADAADADGSVARVEFRANG